jgi:hypothetical protein
MLENSPDIAREKALERYTLRGEQSSATAAYYRAAGEEMEKQDLESEHSPAW